MIVSTEQSVLVFFIRINMMGQGDCSILGHLPALNNKRNHIRVYLFVREHVHLYIGLLLHIFKTGRLDLVSIIFLHAHPQVVYYNCV